MTRGGQHLADLHAGVAEDVEAYFADVLKVEGDGEEGEEGADRPYTAPA